jgi:hypothetical protein
MVSTRLTPRILIHMQKYVQSELGDSVGRVEKAKLRQGQDKGRTRAGQGRAGQDKAVHTALYIRLQIHS